MVTLAKCDVFRDQVKQSNAIWDVGHSIDAINSVTQQNAALVEQSAAAQALQTQAKHLEHMKGTFKVST